MIPTDEHQNKIGRTFKTQIIILGGFVLFIWLLEAVDWVLGGQLDALGIRPRTLVGLRGILLAPVLHAGFGHVAANTVTFIVLGWFVLLRNLRTFVLVTLIVVVVGGLGTWLIGPTNSVHLGASGLVFGYFGYLLMRGYFERSWNAVAWSLIVAVLYGGLIFGIIPGEIGISWQMHLFGFIGGGVAAYWLAKPMSKMGG
ncbi:MAG: rhomboid family intramembrane serine protease [Anaerolineales bacterium]|nr:rhomboid family intramembrane serine protease [Anaerolineales bacterium]